MELKTAVTLNCITFALVREQAYPLEMLALFDSIGIDFKKENEVHHYGRTPGGLHIYRGWFYVVGSIKQGPDSWLRLGDGKCEGCFHRITPTFEVGLTQIFQEGFTKKENLPWRSYRGLEPEKSF